jgi:catechol 2,3-dioxygenase-like lactoylglutathione lyase family enzyme
MNDQKPLVTRTDFVFLPITSFEKAEEFYSGVLGLECSKRYDNAVGGEFEPSKGAIALHVENVEAARSELESRGVNFEGETMDSGVCYQALFADQDGNALILHHRYAPPAVKPGA